MYDPFFSCLNFPILRDYVGYISLTFFEVV
jgi:hypothetical protein